MELLVSIIPFEGLVTTILDKFFPNQTEIKKADLELKRVAIEAEAALFAAKAGLLQGQMSTNTAEAANPNRKWVTWRECLGYILVVAIGYQWLVLPVVSLIALFVGHPLDMSKIYTIEILDVIYLMCGMLGLDAAPLIANKIRGQRPK